MGAVRTLLTFEQFEQLPDKDGRRELLEGELIELPPPFIEHDEGAHQLLYCFNAALKQFRAQGRDVPLGKAYLGVGYRLATRSYLIPDVSISHANQPRGRYLEGSPALAVEVVSESNTAGEMSRKVQAYLAGGAREVWVIYPDERLIWIHQPSQPPQAYSGLFQSDLLPGIEIDLDEILAA
ncbi:MAG: Uma2 family endonuclease [Acidobacteriia bacterium]|nr:Uma2 family endonuclease [Terriglobia bacterium]